MRQFTNINTAAMAVVIACLGGFGLSGCMDSNPNPTDQASVDFLALTQSPPVPGNSPCAGVCPIDPGASDSFRCVEVAVGVESCVPVKELLCGNNSDDDMDGTVDCADSDCGQNPACLPAPVTCGNNVLDNGEVCDGGTGCQNDCTCPLNQVIDGSKGCKVPPAPCGNGVLDNGEVCDGGTGCQNDCTCPLNQVTDGSKGCKVPPAPCGNGVLDNGEVCDGGTGCQNDCTCPLNQVTDGSKGCKVAIPPPATETCDDGIDNDGDSKVDVSDEDCATKVVATFSVCVKAGETATISVVAGSGESIEGNYHGAAVTGTCYPFSINGADAYAKVWVRSTWRKFVSDHTFVVWDDGVSVSPLNWPQGQGIPVVGSYTSDSGLVQQWVNFFVAGATE